MSYNLVRLSAIITSMLYDGVDPKEIMLTVLSAYMIARQLFGIKQDPCLEEICLKIFEEV